MYVSPWPKSDQRWYLGVRCKKCKSPILFALDHSEGAEERQQPALAGKLVLTCSADTCRHRADYTASAVSRFQKEPEQVARTTRKDESNQSSSRKRS